MDALDVMGNKEKAFPHFQPIISADKKQIIGYEVLGRIQTEEGIEDLSFFFEDTTIPEEYILEIDTHIRNLAIEHYKSHGTGECLFFNCNASHLLYDHGETITQSLEEYANLGIPYNRIVLEVSGYDVDEDNLGKLQHLLTYYSSLGVQIAVSHYGNKMSNIEKIAILNPNLIKVNLYSLKDKGMPQEYRDVLYALSMLGRKIGATLLFEGIDGHGQMKYAWENGGRYYQGNYIKEPGPVFLDRAQFKPLLSKEIHQFINHERNRLLALYHLSRRFNDHLQKQIKMIKQNDWDDIVSQASRSLKDACFRGYICNEDGDQVSSNYYRNDDGSWELQPEYVGNNWSWRPYFLENIIRMKHEGIGNLSDMYSDIETNELIRTYSYPINETHYLFLDIPYLYLYDRDHH
ncbi:EAL domain-containing protein [Guptibacillus algicola]|uniref:EAL domain-containing protein n=1 Tax=Guptibacillus algicola TaxID=225844 RepID=UPI001CD32615|nr:EAL-associated domain-containing protein [Alkalihalobacillus algicola]MCA0989343.1 EAL domain-containing protein [Alkalihalobacillus algicola]